MYGYIADGYWCDVGHCYRESQYDGLQRNAKLDYACRATSGHLGGQNTHIDPSAKIAARSNCTIAGLDHEQIDGT